MPTCETCHRLILAVVHLSCRSKMGSTIRIVSKFLKFCYYHMKIENACLLLQHFDRCNLPVATAGKRFTDQCFSTRITFTLPVYVKDKILIPVSKILKFIRRQLT